MKYLFLQGRLCLVGVHDPCPGTKTSGRVEGVIFLAHPLAYLDCHKENYTHLFPYQQHVLFQEAPLPRDPNENCHLVDGDLRNDAAMTFPLEEPGKARVDGNGRGLTFLRSEYLFLFRLVFHGCD